MIEIKHLSKTFQMKDGAVNALKDINLTIPDGSIYGIIGMSGAGKFTLVGAALGALTVAVMQLLGARLLTGASRNPMLAPFAAIIGVLIWFNLVAQVIMICAAFIAECRRGGGESRS